MLLRITLALFLASVTPGQAEPAAAKLIGKWVWQRVDAQITLSFAPDHTCSLEGAGLDDRYLRKGAWKIEGSRLIISWVGQPDEVRNIIKITSHTLVLGWPSDGTQTYTRTE